MKEFEVVMHIEAPNRAAVERMLDRMPNADRILDDKITCPEEERFLQGRIMYCENWNDGFNGDGEYYIFSNKWSDETEWNFECSFHLLPYEKDGVYQDGVLLNYQALTKIREWNKLGIPFFFC